MDVSGLIRECLKGIDCDGLCAEHKIEQWKKSKNIFHKVQDKSQVE